MSTPVVFQSKDEVPLFFRPEVSEELCKVVAELDGLSDDGWSWWDGDYYVWRPTDQSLESFEASSGASKGVLYLDEDGTWRHDLEADGW